MDAHSSTRLFTYWTKKGLFPFKWWRMACDKLRHQMNASLVRVQNLYTSLPTCGVDFGGHARFARGAASTRSPRGVAPWPRHGAPRPACRPTVGLSATALCPALASRPEVYPVCFQAKDPRRRAGTWKAPRWAQKPSISRKSATTPSATTPHRPPTRTHRLAMIREHRWASTRRRRHLVCPCAPFSA